MYNFGQEIQRAIEKRMAWDILAATRRNRRRQEHEELHSELAALASGTLENPTEFQEFVQARVHESVQDVERLLEVAFNGEMDPDVVREAVANLIAGILGQVMSLELRTGLLERAVDQP